MWMIGQHSDIDTGTGYTPAAIQRNVNPTAYRHRITSSTDIQYILVCSTRLSSYNTMLLKHRWHRHLRHCVADSDACWNNLTYCWVRHARNGNRIPGQTHARDHLPIGLPEKCLIFWRFITNCIRMLTSAEFKCHQFTFWFFFHFEVT